MTSISLYCLNVMHGRDTRSAVFPPFISRRRAEKNLIRIADSIAAADPDIVALQEIDEASICSGSFDQVAFLNARLGYPYTYFAPSCSLRMGQSGLFVTGNALFSKFPLERCEAFRFGLSFPNDRMGFVIADVRLPGGKAIAVTSIHLVWVDWTRLAPRASELDMVASKAGERKHPVVMLGDFNCDMTGREDSLRVFSRRLGLHTCQPQSAEFHTYPSWAPSRRIDWIFVPSAMSISSYRVLPERVSDHRAVVAEVSIP